MTLAKAVISGIVKRDPRITSPQSNMDLKIANFSVSIDGNEDDTLRVVAFGRLAESVEQNVKAGNKVVVEGQLMTYVGKDANGQDVKTLELRLASLEVVSGSSSPAAAPISSSTEQTSEVVKFSDTEEIPEDIFGGNEEIPF